MTDRRRFTGTCATLHDIYIAPLNAQKLHAQQREAVKKYLRENGEINRDFAYDAGLPECGRIKNLGGRIHDLRTEGWHIETEIRSGLCFYKLIAEPMSDTGEKRPRIMMMGEHGMEEVPYDSIPEPSAAQLEDYFKPVRISPRAMDIASKIIPKEHWEKKGLHAFLQDRADEVFQKLSSSETEARRGKLRYFFEYDADGPVLKTVSL
jgi:hypothetical protein